MATATNRATRRLLRFALLSAFVLLNACGGDFGPGGLVKHRGDEAEQVSREIGQVLDELQDYSAPSGVDPQVFEELRRELSRVLEEHWGERVVSGAPQGPGNAVTDLELADDGGGGMLLEWSYLNTGDYDQNSVVSVTDLTPIGINFNKTDADPGWEAIKHVDGDGNGRITVQDVTPIGIFYLSKVAHYEIAIDEPDSDVYTNIGQALFDASSGTPRTFSVPLPAGGDGLDIAVRPADGAGDFGPWSAAPTPEPIDELPGPVGAPAVENIPDMPFPLGSDSDYIILEDNFALSHRLLLVHVAPESTVGEVNSALAAVSASIIGANPHGDLLQLRIQAETFDNTVVALESLIDSGAFSEATMDMAGAMDMLPLHASDPNLWTFEYPSYGFPPLPSANYWIKTIKAPQAWNLDTYIKRNRSNNPIEAGIIDGGFDTGHEDIGARINLGGTANGGAAGREHGSFVSGIIGADGGNGLGMSGVYPWGQTMHCRTMRTTDFSDLASWSLQISSIVDMLFYQPQVKAINNSYGMGAFYAPGAGPAIDPVAHRFGDRNGDGDHGDANEWAPVDLDRNLVPDTYAEVMNILGRLYRSAVASYVAETTNDRFLLVSTAGNSGNGYRAQDNSPLANAAVNFSGNFAVVGSTNSSNLLSGFSHVGFTLSAPGSCVRSAEADNGSNYDSAECNNHDLGDSAHYQRYATNSGTSFAAPQVTALACLLWKLDPQLTLAQVRTLMRDPAYTLDAGGALRIDCFAAAMGIDIALGNTTLQQALADLDDGSLDGNLREDPFAHTPVTSIATADQRRGDGTIDMSDFRAFRDAHLLANAAELSIVSGSVNVAVGLDGPATHFKNDLNSDGAVGTVAASPAHPADIGTPSQLSDVPIESVFSRYDLNGDGTSRYWDYTAPFKLDPDGIYGSNGGSALRDATMPRRDIDILLDPAYWADSIGTYNENAGNSSAMEGNTGDNGSWLPKRYLLGNRDGYITTPAALVLASTPDYLHSCDFHLRIAWDSFDPEVTSVHVQLESDIWPDGVDNDGTSGTDEPFENSFERYADFARVAGSQDMVVTMPLWTGALKISWEAMGSGDDCELMASKVFTGVAFGADVSYNLPGDSGGNSDWEVVTLDQDGDAGKYSSIALVGGNPAIAYYAGSDVKYIRSADATGMSWGAAVTAAPSAEIGVSISLAVAAGRPCIGYSDSMFVDLDLGQINAVTFVRAADTTGNGWSAPTFCAQITTGIPQMGWHSDLLEVGGVPAMCFLGEDYAEETGTALNFVGAESADGATWKNPVQVDNAGSPEGFWCSMALVNGMPAIAYLSSVNHKICFVRASSADGSSWDTPTEIDGAGGYDYFGPLYPGKHAALAVVNGKPAVAYFGGHDLEIGSMLKYAIADDADGALWNAPLILATGSPEPGDATGVYCSLAVVGDYPAVSFCNFGDGDLLYVEAVDADGTLWFGPEEVDCNGDVGRFSSMTALGDGRPAISYYDATGGNLKFAKRTD